MNITIEKLEKNSLTFAYVWRGEPDKAPPVMEFHTSVEGNAGKAIVEKIAQDWVAAQQGVRPAADANHYAALSGRKVSKNE
jgi:hypothetical protein